jgi:hypothetical protein
VARGPLAETVLEQQVAAGPEQAGLIMSRRLSWVLMISRRFFRAFASDFFSRKRLMCMRSPSGRDVVAANTARASNFSGEYFHISEFLSMKTA